MHLSLPLWLVGASVFCVSILLSNDDGTAADGITVWPEAIASVDEVWVVAPDLTKYDSMSALRHLDPRWP